MPLWQNRRGSRLLATNFMFLHISSANCRQIYRKLLKPQNFYIKSFKKNAAWGDTTINDTFVKHSISVQLLSHHEHAMGILWTRVGHRQNKHWSSIAHALGNKCPNVVATLGQSFRLRQARYSIWNYLIRALHTDFTLWLSIKRHRKKQNTLPLPDRTPYTPTSHDLFFATPFATAFCTIIYIKNLKTSHSSYLFCIFAPKNKN